MGHWIIGGKQYSDEEYGVYKQQEEERWARVQEETGRLISAVAEAYRTCEKFIEDNPQYPYGLKDDAERREFKILEKLRSNLGAANQAPRCEKVREDGRTCGSPKMKGYGYCYAHERMLQMQSQKLELPAQDDANGIQMAIMRVQKALIDNEISERKAGLLLYSLQMASSNLKHTTFDHESEDVVTEMPRAALSSQHSAFSGPEDGIWESEISPLINTDDTDQSLLPRMNAESRGSTENAPTVEMRKQSHHGDAEARRKPSQSEKQNPLTTHSTPLRAGCGHEGTRRKNRSGKSTPICDECDGVR